MKLVGYLVVALSLILGTIGASTAYLARMSLPDERLIGLELNQPVWGEPVAAEGAQAQDAGAADAETQEGDAAAPEPLAPAGATLTAELLETLRTAKVTHVRVKSFSFGRWEGKWWTGLGVVGLLVGAMLLRSRAKAAHAAAMEHPSEGADSPRALMEGARQSLLALHAEAEQAPAGHDRAHLIMTRVAALQRSHMNPLIESRQRMRARLGLAGFARVMDRFASAERQVNRAWSAAADGDDEEALVCLPLAAESLAEAMSRME